MGIQLSVVEEMSPFLGMPLQGEISRFSEHWNLGIQLSVVEEMSPFLGMPL